MINFFIIRHPSLIFLVNRVEWYAAQWYYRTSVRIYMDARAGLVAALSYIYHVTPHYGSRNEQSKMQMCSLAVGSLVKACIH